MEEDFEDGMFEEEFDDFEEDIESLEDWKSEI
jgi:hypothetical protein